MNQKEPVRLKMTMPNDYAIAIQWDSVQQLTTVFTPNETRLLYYLLDQATDMANADPEITSWTTHYISYKDYGFKTLAKFRETLTKLRQITLCGDISSKTAFERNVIVGWEHTEGTRCIKIKWDDEFLSDMSIFKFNPNKINYFNFFILENIKNKYYYPVMWYFLRAVNTKTAIRLTIQEKDFRTLTGTMDKYPLYKRLNQEVIKPTIEAINKEDNGLVIKFIRKDPKTSALTFQVINKGVLFDELPTKYTVKKIDSKPKSTTKTNNTDETAPKNIGYNDETL